MLMSALFCAPRDVYKRYIFLVFAISSIYFAPENKYRVR